jgi:hypothetical protein
MVCINLKQVYTTFVTEGKNQDQEGLFKRHYSSLEEKQESLT